MVGLERAPPKEGAGRQSPSWDERTHSCLAAPGGSPSQRGSRPPSGRRASSSGVAGGKGGLESNGPSLGQPGLCSEFRVPSSALSLPLDPNPNSIRRTQAEFGKGALRARSRLDSSSPDAVRRAARGRVAESKGGGSAGGQGAAPSP